MKILKSEFVIVFFIISLGLAVRLVNIGFPLLEYFPQRQTQTAEMTRNIYKNGWLDFWTPKVRYFTRGEAIPYVQEFPLYNGFVALLYHAFGPAVIWGRLASLTFFIGSSLVFYRLVQSTINNQQLTMLALIFFVFSPLHILISRNFQPEELALFLLLLAVYKKSWLTFSLAVLTKLPIVVFAPLMFFSSSLRVQPKARHDNLLDSSTHALTRSNFTKLMLSLFPSIFWYFRASRVTVHPIPAINFSISNRFQLQLWFQSHWYFSLFQIEHVWVLTTLGLLFFWIGFWLIITQRKLFWLIWLANGLLYLTIFNYHTMTHEYYHLFLLPPLSVFVATGLKKILDITKLLDSNFRLIAVSGILLLFLSGLIQPAIKKIISAPKSPSESEEMTLDRYQYIEDF